MKNRNGFIATSLIYSFFLLFCGLLLSYVALFLHNNNLLDKVEEAMYDDIYNIKTLKDVPFGSLVKLQLDNDNSNINLTDDNLFVLLNDNESNIILVSLTPIFIFTTLNITNNHLTNIKYKYNNDENTVFYSNIFSLETYNNYNKNNISNLIFNMSYNKVETEDNQDNNSNHLISTYLIGDAYYYEVWSDNINEKKVNDIKAISFNPDGTAQNYAGDIYVRLEFKLPNSLQIISGDGSLNSPYELGDI